MRGGMGFRPGNRDLLGRGGGFIGSMTSHNLSSTRASAMRLSSLRFSYCSVHGYRRYSGKTLGHFIMQDLCRRPGTAGLSTIARRGTQAGHTIVSNLGKKYAFSNSVQTNAKPTPAFARSGRGHASDPSSPRTGPMGDPDYTIGEQLMILPLDSRKYTIPSSRRSRPGRGHRLLITGERARSPVAYWS